MGYSPWSCKESNRTKRLTVSLFFQSLRIRTHTVYTVRGTVYTCLYLSCLKARILKEFAIPFSSRPHFVTDCISSRPSHITPFLNIQVRGRVTANKRGKRISQNDLSKVKTAEQEERKCCLPTVEAMFCNSHIEIPREYFMQ